MEQNTEVFGLPRLNEPAPNFVAKTTHGDRTLADYKGKWLILFSHPADFTPVCTTEFMGFAREAETFKSMNCELLGLSIDSIFAHLAWVRSIKQHFGVDIPFPIIEDLKMDVARAYGMIHPGAADTQAVRATFFIDPDGIIRAVTKYPHNVGRSVDEMLRLLTALQRVADGKRLAPEGWTPGKPLLRPVPDRPGEGADWFCRFEVKR